MCAKILEVHCLADSTISGLPTTHKPAVSKATVREQGVRRASDLQAGSLLAPLKQKASPWRWGENSGSCPIQIPVLSLGIAFSHPSPQPRIAGPHLKCHVSHGAGARDGLGGKGRGQWDPQLAFRPNQPPHGSLSLVSVKQEELRDNLPWAPIPESNNTSDHKSFP